MNRFCSWVAPWVLIAAAACGTQSSARYRIALVPSGAGQHGIFVMNSDTTGGKLLVTDVAAQVRSNSWSPDGGRIAFFTTRRDDFGLLEKYQLPQHLPLYVMDASGGNQRRVLDFPVISFGWSPDGRKLFFVSAYEDPARNDPQVISGAKAPMSAVYTLDPQSGEQKRITTFGQNCTASWSPDGTRLALSLGEAGNADLYVTTLDAVHAKRLTDSPATDIRPAWSPDGKRIAYTSLAGAGADPKEAGIYVIEVDSGKKTKLTDMATYGTSWSPDGKLLLLQAMGGIFLVDGQGKVTKVKAPTNSLLDATFTPDGREVMFRSKYEGDWNLYAVDLASGKSRRLTEQISAFMFCVSPLL